jgi:hypothetical protein
VLNNAGGSPILVKKLEKGTQIAIQDIAADNKLLRIWTKPGAGGPKGGPPFMNCFRLFACDKHGNLPAGVIRSFPAAEFECKEGVTLPVAATAVLQHLLPSSSSVDSSTSSKKSKRASPTAAAAAASNNNITKRPADVRKTTNHHHHHHHAS